MKMTKFTRRLALGATAMAALLAVTPAALAQAKKEVLGVSMPAATHSFMAGAVYWAGEAKKDLEKANPNIQVIVKTAANASEQANQLQDLMTVNKITSLVVFPFESAALTKPVAQGSPTPARRTPTCPATTPPSARSRRSTSPRR
jgi:ribose transport system substrate-binding protein